MSGKDASGAGATGMYDRFGLFAAAAANAWSRTNPWYAGSSGGGGGGGCGGGGPGIGAGPPGAGAPRHDYHPHRAGVHHPVSYTHLTLPTNREV